MSEIRLSDILGVRANGPVYGRQGVRFFYHFIDDAEGTKAAGHYKCKEIEMIEVSAGPGDKRVVPATDKHRSDYAGLYKDWKDSEGPAVAGFPIFQWPLITRMACIELAHYGLKTLEQLAEVDEGKRQKLGALAEWCDRAKDYLELSKEPKSVMTKLKEENKALLRKLQKTEDQLALILQRVSAAEGIRLEHVSP